MDRKEFTDSKTIVSPDGKTVTTVTVSISSEQSSGSSAVTTSVKSTSSN